MSALLTASPEDCATAVATIIARVADQLGDWRDRVLRELGGATSPLALDGVVEPLVIPELMREDPLLVGAGFIAAPDFVQGRDVHFSWWLGPMDANPILGSTTEPTRLDLSTRSYAEYLSDVRSLEWYAVPAATGEPHITGPYVDHLCTCDYILTLTIPVEIDGTVMGVVGGDIAVRRLERELLALFLAVESPLALVNEEGRVVVSTAPSVLPGTLADAEAARIACPGTPLSIVRLD